MGYLDKARIIAIDFETTRVPNHHPWRTDSVPVCVSLTSDIEEFFIMLYHNHEPRGGVDIRNKLNFINKLLNSYDVVAAHNLKFESVWCRHLGLSYKQGYCTQSVEYLLSGQDKRVALDLDSVSIRYGGSKKLDLVKSYWAAGYETEDIPKYVLEPYNTQDTQITLEIVRAQLLRLTTRKHLIPLIQMEHEKIKEMADAAYLGMRFDSDRAIELAKEAQQDLAKMYRELNEIAGWEVDCASHLQLSALLYGGGYPKSVEQTYERQFKNHSATRTRTVKVSESVAGLGITPPSSKNKDGSYPTSVDVLSQLETKTPQQKRIVELLLSISKLAKLDGTYYTGLLDKVCEGYLHPILNNTVSSTGRLSCSAPNGQNIPRDGNAPVKDLFISRYKE